MSPIDVSLLGLGVVGLIGCAVVILWASGILHKHDPAWLRETPFWYNGGYHRKLGCRICRQSLGYPKYNKPMWEYPEE